MADETYDKIDNFVRFGARLRPAMVEALDKEAEEIGISRPVGSSSGVQTPVKLRIDNPKQGTVDDQIAIAKRWYAEQRGRIVGNTVSWDQLSENRKLNIIDAVIDALEVMEESWQPRSSASSNSNHSSTTSTT